jgi:hypothetical protein
VRFPHAVAYTTEHIDRLHAIQMALHIY